MLCWVGGFHFAVFRNAVQDAPDASAAQKASRAYNSWLAWWKNTLNTDDYMKFLATQESDFLSHIFHLYDSDLEEDDEDDEETGSASASATTSRATKRNQAESRRDQSYYYYLAYKYQLIFHSHR